MTRSTSINSYIDIKQQLEEMREMDGAEIDLGSFGAAVSWVARVYTYRSMLRDQAKIGMPEGYDPSTPWDDIVLRHDKKHRASSVTIQFGIMKRGKIKALPKGIERPRTILTDLEIAPVSEDDLLAAAVAEVNKAGDKK